jgi:hypothetical protein
MKKKAFFPYLAGMFLLLGLTLYNFIRLLHLYSHHPVDVEQSGSLVDLVAMGLLTSGFVTLLYLYSWRK